MHMILILPSIFSCYDHETDLWLSKRKKDLSHTNETYLLAPGCIGRDGFLNKGAGPDDPL